MLKVFHFSFRFTFQFIKIRDLLWLFIFIIHLKKVLSNLSFPNQKKNQIPPQCIFYSNSQLNHLEAWYTLIIQKIYWQFCLFFYIKDDNYLIVKYPKMSTILHQLTPKLHITLSTLLVKSTVIVVIFAISYPAVLPTPFSAKRYQKLIGPGFSTNWFKTKSPMH